jgi:Uma2 family endonuclease
MARSTADVRATDARAASESAGGPRRHRFTVADFYRMAEVGIFHEDSRVELIDGEIIDMSPIGSRHMRAVNRLTKIFVGLAGDAAIVSVRNPIDLGEHTHPEPDVVLLRPSEDEYGGAHPTARDVLLIVEVADSSVEFDLKTKAAMYAAAGIADYWVWDIPGDGILVHRDPSPDGYRFVQTFRRGETLAPLAFPEHALAIDELLG